MIYLFMTKIQLDNLIRFSLLFRSIDYKKQSPDYIYENWFKYIGIDLSSVKEDIDNPEAEIYFKTWGYVEKNKLLPVLNYLYLNLINDDFSPTHIISNFNTIFDVSFIKNQLYNNLHYNLNKYFEELIQKELRDYNLSLLV